MNYVIVRRETGAVLSRHRRLDVANRRAHTLNEEGRDVEVRCPSQSRHRRAATAIARPVTPAKTGLSQRQVRAMKQSDLLLAQLGFAPDDPKRVEIREALQSLNE